MHLVFNIRGVPQQKALWVAMAQNLFFKWRRTNMETNEEVITLVQGGLRDSILGTMEFTFPEEALPTVLSIMGIKEGDLNVIPSWKMSMKTAVFRKMLGLKKIPHKAFVEAESIPPSIMFDDLERGFSDLSSVHMTLHP